MVKIEKILVTGATGFIGSNLTQMLYKNGYEVYALIRTQSDSNKLKRIKDMVHFCEFNGETNQLIRIMNQIKPSYVIHLASYFTSEHKPEEIIKIIDSNIILGCQLLEASAASGVLYFINTGSYFQNYNGDLYNPTNFYAASKQAFETFIKFYMETSQIRFLTLKLTDTYGPFDSRPKLMNLLKKIAKTGESLDMSPGEQEIGFVYIDDVVKGYMTAIDAIRRMEPGEHGVFLLSPEKLYKLKEAVQIFEKVVGKKLNILWGKRSYRNREIMKITSNDPWILKGSDLTDLEEGISKMLHKEGFFNS